MPDEARIRIDSHRLMQPAQQTDADKRVENSRQELKKKKKLQKELWVKRAKVHVVLFVVSFLFTLGVFTLGILIWGRAEELLPIVLVSIASAGIFVASFTALRMLVLHVLFNEYPNKEEDPGVEHHLAKSIAYAFVGLVFALVVAGVIINIVSGNII